MGSYQGRPRPNPVTEQPAASRQSSIDWLLATEDGLLTPGDVLYGERSGIQGHRVGIMAHHAGQGFALPRPDALPQAMLRPDELLSWLQTL